MSVNTIQKLRVSGLSKKPKHVQKVVGYASRRLVISVIYSKHTKLSHLRLRERTLARRRAKLFNSLRAALSSQIQSHHGVELTDDVIVRDIYGNRVHRTITPIDRIDQLPQFQKG